MENETTQMDILKTIDRELNRWEARTKPTRLGIFIDVLWFMFIMTVFIFWGMGMYLIVTKVLG